MKQNIKKNLIIFGAMITVLLMVSSTTAINVVEQKIIINMEKEVYVDPNIHLRKNQLPKLLNALEYINDPKDKALIEEIIQTIKTKGAVDSNDLYEIANKLDIKDRSFYYGYIEAYGRFCSARYFPFHILRFLLFGGLANFGLWLFAKWYVSDSNYTSSCTINGRDVNANSGFVLIGFGGWYFGNPTVVVIPGYFKGFFALICVGNT